MHQLCISYANSRGRFMFSQKTEVIFSRMKWHAIFFYIFVYSVLQNRHLQEGNKKLEALLQVLQVGM